MRRESERRIRANRRNARKSTGPRTVEGKAKSSKNALKHGVLSNEMLLPDENPDDLEGLRAGIVEHLLPVGELEAALVDLIISDLWRLRRVNRVEASILTQNIFLERASRADARAGRFTKRLPSPMETTFQDWNQQYESKTEVTDENEYAKENLEAQRARDMANSDSTIIGDAFLRDAQSHDALAKLSRYGTAIQRNLYRALHQLERMQASRAGTAVPAPAALDVDVSVDRGD